jgi:hypothetical protein
MTLINLEDFSQLMKIEDFHFGHVTILKSVKDPDRLVLWKREDKLGVDRLALYTSQLSQRRQISNANLLSLIDFKIDSASGTIDVFFEYSPYKSSAIVFGCIDVAFKWLADVLTALSYLNSLGFVHGDMRPEFVVYFPSQGKFKIVDKFANFTHPSAALKNYIKTGKEIYVSPRFFNEICNKKMKDAKFNFYKNESFSVGLVLLKILYGPAVDLKQIYNHKFKIFNTFDFLELLKKLQLNAFCSKEKGLLEFLKTKLLCFNEGDRLSPARALEEVHELIRGLYGVDALNDGEANRVFLAKEHKNILVHFSGLRLASETKAIEERKEDTEDENAAVSEVIEQSCSNSSREKKSQTYKRNNITIELDEAETETLAKNRPVTAQNPLLKVDPQNDSNQTNEGIQEHKSNGNRITGRQLSVQAMPVSTRQHNEQVITDLEYLSTNNLLKKKVQTPDILTKREGSQMPVELRQYPLTASNSKYYGDSSNNFLMNVPFEKRTLLIKQDEWKPFVEAKTPEVVTLDKSSNELMAKSMHQHNKMESTAFSFGTPAIQTVDLKANNTQEAVPSGKDFELFINFTVIVPEEKILVSKKIVPSLSIETMDSFDLSIKNNQLKVKFLEKEVEKEALFSLDEISKTGLSLHLTNRNSEVKLKHNYVHHTKNIASIDNLESKEPDFGSSNPKVIRRYVRSNQTFSSLTSDQFKVIKAQEYQLPRNESQKPTISTSSQTITAPPVIRGAYISQAYPVYTQMHSSQPSVFSSRAIYPSTEEHRDTYNSQQHVIDSQTSYPNSRFVNVIHSTVQSVSYPKRSEQESYHLLQESAKYPIVNDSHRANILIRQPAQNVMERYGGARELKISQSSIFGNRVL